MGIEMLIVFVNFSEQLLFCIIVSLLSQNSVLHIRWLSKAWFLGMFQEVNQNFLENSTEWSNLSPKSG